MVIEVSLRCNFFCVRAVLSKYLQKIRKLQYPVEKASIESRNSKQIIEQGGRMANLEYLNMQILPLEMQLQIPIFSLVLMLSGNRRKKVVPRRAHRLSQLQAFVVAAKTLSKTFPWEAIQVPVNEFVATPFFDSLSLFLIFIF